MGVAISRKAILGGVCVDTGYDLGESISQLVNVYISLAGVAYGLERCSTEFFQSKTLKGCNKLNGMLCNSEFIMDINSPDKRYEGVHSFGVYSKDDLLVGQKCCNNICSELKNAEQQIVLTKTGHISVLLHTLDIQYNLILNYTNISCFSGNDLKKIKKI